MRCTICSSENPDGAGQCATCGAQVGTPVGAGHDPSVLPSGTSLHHGTYLITTCVGHGGFGITYLATDQKLGRPVAVKEYFPSGCVRDGVSVRASGGWSPEGYGDGRARFLEEGRALARFDHPGIVRVHAAFEENQTAYIVMEFLQGKTLEEILRERGGRLPVAEARICAERIAAALDEVHRAGLLHRDVKPANVMVVGSDSLLAHPRVVLVDFGTAREFVAGVSQNHSVVLTRGYAPLEQYSQRAMRGPYTDVYALSALLYQALTGAPPPDAHDRVFGDTLHPVASVNPDVDPSLGRAIMRGLEMEAARRPQTVREFVAEMNGVVPPSAGGSLPVTQVHPQSLLAAGGGASSGSVVRGSGASLQGTLPPTVMAGQTVAAPSAPPLPFATSHGRAGAHGGPAQPAVATKGAFIAVVLLGVLLVAWALGGSPKSGSSKSGSHGTASSPVALSEKPGGEGAVGAPSGLEAAGTNSRGFPEFTGPKDGTVLVRIPGGTFQMGSNEQDDEKSIHSVTLPPYLIGRVPVTNTQFARFVSATSYDAGSQWREYASKWGDQAPVVCVSWNDATAYANWAGLRLPTEEEWEFAARGPQGFTYPWGNDWDASKCQNSVGHQSDRAVPVGSFPSGASPFGCLDMAGNVWQWTASWYDRYPGNTSSDSMYGQKVRVLRGGSWSSTNASIFRGADRLWFIPDSRLTSIGFRVARTL